MTRNRPFLILMLTAGLPACVGGGTGAPIAEPITASAPIDANRVFPDVRQHIDENGEITFSAALCDHSKHRFCKAHIPTDSSGHPLISPRPGEIGRAHV